MAGSAGWGHRHIITPPPAPTRAHFCIYTTYSATEREERLDILRKRKRGEEIAPAAAEPSGAAEAGAAAAQGGEGEDAVAAGARRGLDNKGLRIPKGKEGYVEGKPHEGHVHLFGDVADQIGGFGIGVLVAFFMHIDFRRQVSKRIHSSIHTQTQSRRPGGRRRRGSRRPRTLPRRRGRASPRGGSTT